VSQVLQDAHDHCFRRWQVMVSENKPGPVVTSDFLEKLTQEIAAAGMAARGLKRKPGDMVSTIGASLLCSLYSPAAPEGMVEDQGMSMQGLTNFAKQTGCSPFGINQADSPLALAELIVSRAGSMKEEMDAEWSRRFGQMACKYHVLHDVLEAKGLSSWGSRRDACRQRNMHDRIIHLENSEKKRKRAEEESQNRENRENREHPEEYVIFSEEDDTEHDEGEHDEGPDDEKMPAGRRTQPKKKKKKKSKPVKGIEGMPLEKIAELRKA